MTGYRMKKVFKKRGQWDRKRILMFSARLVLGLVFVYASVDKIIHPAAFADTVYNYRLLPDSFINLTAIVLPWLEFLLGLLLMAGLWFPGVSFLSAFLMASFFAAIAFNAARGLDVHCGCFTVSANDKSQIRMAWYVIRDLVFFIMSLYLFFCAFREWTPDGIQRKDPLRAP